MYCKTCKVRKTCQAVCKPLAEFLRGEGIYSADYIRKRNESPFDNNKLEKIAAKQAFKLKHGKRTIPKFL